MTSCKKEKKKKKRKSKKNFVSPKFFASEVGKPVIVEIAFCGKRVLSARRRRNLFKSCYARLDHKATWFLVDSRQIDTIMDYDNFRFYFKVCEILPLPMPLNNLNYEKFSVINNRYGINRISTKPKIMLEQDIKEKRKRERVELIIHDVRNSQEKRKIYLLCALIHDYVKQRKIPAQDRSSFCNLLSFQT